MARAEEYDAKKVTCTVNGTVITGYATDGVVTITTAEDGILPNTGVQGEVAYAINANDSGTLTLTLQSTSASLKFLRGLYASKAAVDVVVNDANSSTGFIMRGEDGRITKMPDIARTKEIGSVQVVIFVPHIEVR